MSEAWREVARIGKKGEKYPHLLVDSHGWCLRLGPRDREDEKYYSSLPNLLQGLYEHLLRRKDRESARATLEMKAILIQNLKEARELGEELERTIPNLRQRLLGCIRSSPEGIGQLLLSLLVMAVSVHPPRL